MKNKSSLMPAQKKMQQMRNPERAKFSMRYFKTGPGEYGEGDIFLGLSALQMRGLAREFAGLPLFDIRVLLKSRIHEERLLALLLLVEGFRKGTEAKRKTIYELYLKNRRSINNWDLVDCSADKIIGAYLIDKPRDVLYELAKSERLWDRRIAIMATFHFIKQGQFTETLKIAHVLVQDKEDLIHKAAGWMLREIGKRDQAVEEQFLQKHYSKMPRTMLRYAIERFPVIRRKQYLQGVL